MITFESELAKRYQGFNMAYFLAEEVENAESYPELTSLLDDLPDFVQSRKAELVAKTSNMSDFYKSIGAKNKYHSFLIS